MSKFYDEKYSEEESYWGSYPSSIARIFFRRFAPGEDSRLLDIGCGEGRDSVFFASNGYSVTGFDSSNAAIEKSQLRAENMGLTIDFFQADINSYRLEGNFNVIFSSGALHYIEMALREELFANYKGFTQKGGLHAHTVPIRKLFLESDPEADSLEQEWRSGEILTYYYDWKIEYFAEEILDDIKSDYKFALNRIIAREPTG